VRNDAPSLGNKTSDRVAAALRAVVSAVPFAGGLLSEIITEVIPNQRAERVERFLIALSEKIDELDARDRYPTKEGPQLELLEAGVRSAAATSSLDKIRYLANCVANGISDAESEAVRNQRIVRIISDLDPEEMIVLLSYKSRKSVDSRKFKEKYSNVFDLPMLFVGANQNDIKKHATFEAAKRHLLSLGLLDEEIQFDRDSGVAKQFAGRAQKRTGLTLVGRLVLFHAGLTDEI
jgi:hypothetical protein